MKSKEVLFITQAAVIAALYVALTFLANAFGLANHAIQVRFSEALTILPFFTPAAIPGVVIGCFLSNILTGCILPDIIFGTLATLIGAVGTYCLRKVKWLAPLPPIIANTVIVPLVLKYAYELSLAYWYMVVTVGIGEIISCGVLGMLLLFALSRVRNTIFPKG